MKVDLTLALRVDPGELPDYIREEAEQNTILEGFPVNDENTAYQIGEMIVDDWGAQHGIKMEVVP